MNFISPAYAQDAGAMGGVIQILPLILIFVVFYFIMIRPQQQKMKAHRAMTGALKRGDRVVTGGGIVGTVVKATEGTEEIIVEVAPNVRVTVLRGTITEMMGEPQPANDPAPPKP